MTLSYHAQYERAERLALIEEVLGFTNVAFTVDIPEENHKYCVTTSGVLMVKGMDEDVLVTAFAITVEKLTYLCRRAGKAQIPPKLYKKVVKNYERHRELFLI